MSGQEPDVPAQSVPTVPEPTFPADEKRDEPRDMRAAPGKQRMPASAPRTRTGQNDEPPASPIELAPRPISPAVVRQEPPHPLAAPFPEHNVVVCVAGCNPPTPGIVFIAPRPKSHSTALLSSAATRDAVDSGPVIPGVIECVAGCYGASTKTYASPTRPPSQQAANPRRAGERRVIPTTHKSAGPRHKASHPTRARLR